MKMFWNKKNPLDRDPWETQPEDNVKKLTASQIQGIVMIIVAILLAGFIAYSIYPDIMSYGTKNPMRDPAYSGNASVGAGTNINDDGAGRMQMQSPEDSGLSAYQCICAYGHKPSLQTLRDADVSDVFYSDDIGESWWQGNQIGVTNVSLEDTWFHKVTDSDLDQAKALYTDLSLKFRFVEYDDELYIISEDGVYRKIDSWDEYTAETGKTTGIDLATCEPGCPADEGLNGYLPMPE